MFSMLPRIARIFRNESPLFAERTKQFPEIAAMERESLPKVMKVIESKTNGEFALGDAVSYADCTLYAVAAFAVEAAGLDPPGRYPETGGLVCPLRQAAIGCLRQIAGQVT